MFNEIKFSKILFLILSVFIVFSPVFVLAQEAPRPDPNAPRPGPTQKVSYQIKIENPFKSNSIEGLLKAIVNDILIPIGSVVATIMVIYAGFLFVTARGNSTQIDKAKSALLYAVIGAAILLGAWVISEAISGTVDQLRK